ncbi:MAG TPA: leucine-rich repeat domain-containing protein, partial [Verrucomicrobiae bacterium]|nr:leucine-rich repeat domain-containing protein [Verrucomicrobiae bacterium]
ADGALLWERRYNGPANSNDWASAVAVDGSGNVVVTGTSYNGTNADYYTAKYAAADGALLWEKRYNGPGNGDDAASSLALGPNGMVAVTGSSSGDYATVVYREVQAQFNYTTENGTITLTGYTGPGGAVAIPDTINGMPVTRIGDLAFYNYTRLTSVTIPNSVTNIGDYAFAGCTNLTSVTIPNSVTSIAGLAFWNCSSLTEVYFQGNAPSVGYGAFLDADNATVYHLPGTTGWGTTFGDRPTALWVLSYPLILNNGPSFGVQAGFSFVISWATNISVVVEASTSLANPAWVPVGTNILTDGASYFSDPQWTNHPARFYRLRSP